MRTSFRLAAVILVCAAALSASGCTPNPPDPKPSASATGNPLFASDEEALAAAEEAYAAYQAVLDSVLVAGGSDPERILTVATESQYENEKAGIDNVVANGYRSTGGSKFDSMRLQHLNAVAAEGADVLTVYVCDDYTNVDVVDPTGTSVVAPDRPDRFPRTVAFEVTGDSGTPIKVSAIDEWTGATFC